MQRGLPHVRRPHRRPVVHLHRASQRTHPLASPEQSVPALWRVRRFARRLRAAGDARLGGRRSLDGNHTRGSTLSQSSLRGIPAFQRPPSALRPRPSDRQRRPPLAGHTEWWHFPVRQCRRTGPHLPCLYGGRRTFHQLRQFGGGRRRRLHLRRHGSRRGPHRPQRAHRCAPHPPLFGRRRTAGERAEHRHAR